jgi:hypothetical protein
MTEEKRKTQSLNYKINGLVCSFESKEKLSDHLNTLIKLNEQLSVESLDPEVGCYDHMQEILELSYQAIPCLKGIQAMASCIQERGTFSDYKHYEITSLGLRCKEILDELMDISDASANVYENNCRAQKLKSMTENDGKN